MLTCKKCGEAIAMSGIHRCPGLQKPTPDPLRAALVAIQELHRPVYEGAEAVGCWRCDWEQDGQWPCNTRRLADDALGGGQDG